MVAPVGGFGRFKSNVGDAIGGMSLANFQDEANMAIDALGARSRLKAAEAGADATRFAGQQMANATMFGGIMQGVSGLASGVIGGIGKMNAANAAKTPSYAGSASSVGNFADGSAWAGANSGFDWGSVRDAGYWNASPQSWPSPGASWGRTGW